MLLSPLDWAVVAAYVVFALAVGYFPCALWGLSPWIALGMGTVTLLVLVRWLGRRADDAPAQPA